MTTRPYVLLSAATSVDGYLDDTSPERLLLSNPDDLDRVDEERSWADAILVGAGTLRADNPRLLVKSEERRARRIADGLPEFPMKVTVTASGDIDPSSAFWQHGGGRKVVFAVGARAAEKTAQALDGLAEVYPVAEGRTWETILEILYGLGIRRLMVEGGGQVHTQLLQQGLADELHLVIAPLLVGQPDAPRMFGAGDYPGGPLRRMRLLETRQIDNVVLLRYAPKESPAEEQVNGSPGHDTRATAADLTWLALACRLAAQCPPSTNAFSVGAVIVAADGTELARGHSREAEDAHVHAEEAALAKLDTDDPHLAEATLYSTLEPCSRRASSPLSCTQRILRSGLTRVVTAWREPALFVDDCQGVDMLTAAGLTVVEIPELAGAASAANSHLHLPTPG